MYSGGKYVLNPKENNFHFYTVPNNRHVMYISGLAGQEKFHSQNRNAGKITLTVIVFVAELMVYIN
jgi:hypothetical protein